MPREKQPRSEAQKEQTKKLAAKWQDPKWREMMIAKQRATGFRSNYNPELPNG